MRGLIRLAALFLFALPLMAQTPAAAKSAHPHLTMDQRFKQANVTHDGQLTEEQAKAGYHSVAKHFAAIDQGKKGYITQDEIRAYNKAQRALHHQSATTKRAPAAAS